MVKGNLEWYSENLWNQSTSSVWVLTNQNGDIKQQNMRSSLRIMGLAESGGPRNQVGSASRPSFWPRRHSLVQSSVYQNESNEVFRLPGDVLIFFSKNCCKNFILQDVRKPPAMQTAKPIEAIVILKPKRWPSERGVSSECGFVPPGGPHDVGWGLPRVRQSARHVPVAGLVSMAGESANRVYS